MRCQVLVIACLAAIFCTATVRPAPAQQEVYHPGETYDSLQAGQDAYWDAEAQRRALIARQLMIEEQIMLQNTWANPQDRYRPVHPESYGPIKPQAYGGPTLADVYGYPPSGGGPVYYKASAPVPAFQPWPRVPNDIWAAPYYGYVRQPIGHMKIWTSRLGYIYKPIYASPPLESPRPTLAAASLATAPQPRRPATGSPMPAGNVRSPAASLASPPPPPRPWVPPPDGIDSKPGEGHDVHPPLAGQEI